MSKKKITIKEGDRLVVNNEAVVITKPSSSNTFEVLVLGANPEAEVKGEHQSDKPKGICKKTVLSIVEKEIDRLEQAETEILMSNPVDDDNDGLFENDPALLPLHINNAQAIMVIKKIHKRINAL